jgi:hypothetical protein
MEKTSMNGISILVRFPFKDAAKGLVVVRSDHSEYVMGPDTFETGQGLELTPIIERYQEGAQKHKEDEQKEQAEEKAKQPGKKAASRKPEKAADKPKRRAARKDPAEKKQKSERKTEKPKPGTEQPYGKGMGWKCRVCGCTDDHACEGGCVWIEPNLCSRCVNGVMGDPLPAPVPQEPEQTADAGADTKPTPEEKKPEAETVAEPAELPAEEQKKQVLF